MSTDDAADALEGALRNAYDVLGRRPETVSTLSDDRKYRERIQYLEHQLSLTISELERKDAAIQKAQDDITAAQKRSAHAEAAAKAANAATDRLKQSSSGWFEERQHLEGKLEEGQQTLKDLESRLAHTLGVLDITKLSLTESEKTAGVLQTSLTSREGDVRALELKYSIAQEECSGLVETKSTLRRTLESHRCKTAAVLSSHASRDMQRSVLNAFVVHRLRRQHEATKVTLAKTQGILTQREATIVTLQAALRVSNARGDVLQEMVDREALRRELSRPVECQTENPTGSVAVQTVSVRMSRGAGSSASLANVDEIAKLRWELSRMRQAAQFENTIMEKEIAATMLYVEEQMGHLIDKCAGAREERDNTAASHRKLQGEHAVVHRLLKEMEEAHSERCADIIELRGEISQLQTELAKERSLTASLRVDISTLSSKVERRRVAHGADIGKYTTKLSLSRGVCRLAFQSVRRLVLCRASLTAQAGRLTAQRGAIVAERHNAADMASVAKIFWAWQRSTLAKRHRRRAVKVLETMARQATRNRLQNTFLLWRAKTSELNAKRDDELIAVQLGRLLAAHDQDVHVSGSVLRSQLHKLLRQVDDTSRQLSQVRSRCEQTAARNDDLEHQLQDAGRANAWLSEEAKSLRDRLRVS